jgi:hypothetical protein
MSTIYRWRSGQPTFTLSVSGIAADNSGVKSVTVSPSTSSIFTSNTVTKVSGGSANSTAAYTGTIQFANILTGSVSGSKTYEISSTTVNWANGGNVTNSTKHSIVICEPATSVTLYGNNSSGNQTVWSNQTAKIPLTISFGGVGDPFIKPSSSSANTVKAKFVSNDNSLVSIDSASAYVTSTSASLVSNTTSSINQSANVTLSVYSQSAANPSSAKDSAAATSLSDTLTVTIKNALKSVSLSAADTHLYVGQTVTLNAICTPHRTGTVYSTAMSATSSSSAVKVSGNFSDTANNNTSITLTGQQAGKATITASYTAATNGIAGSVTTGNIICSSLGASKDVYTYVGGSGSFTVSHDTKSNDSDSAKATASTTSTNDASGTFSYSGKASGVNTVTMTSGAKVVITCSSLQANTNAKVISSSASGTSTSITFANDAVSSASTNSYFSYSPSTTSVVITANAGKTGTGTITMRSGAKITVTVSSASVTDNDVRLNVGDKKTVTFDTTDSIKSATNANTNYTYAPASGSVTITATKAGSGVITLNSGLTINVTVSDISVSIS